MDVEGGGSTLTSLRSLSGESLVLPSSALIGALATLGDFVGIMLEEESGKPSRTKVAAFAHVLSNCLVHQLVARHTSTDAARTQLKRRVGTGIGSSYPWQPFVASARHGIERYSRARRSSGTHIDLNKPKMKGRSGVATQILGIP